MIKIFGHKSPDTDATASAIIWAWHMTHNQNTPTTPYVLGTPNTEAAFVLKHWNIDQPEIISAINKNDQVIIVDTNNPAELVENLDQAEIIQIIDHHKLVGGITTAKPIDITIKPLASTASVMATLMSELDMEALPREIKGLMLSCIISDTLAFRSPTTTTFDQTLAESLALELDININSYADQMFTAKSDVSHLSAEELIYMDSKQYSVQDKKFRVSVVETTDPQSILDRKSEITKALPIIAEKDGVDGVLFFIVDIIREESTFLLPDDITKQVALTSFEVKIDSDQILLPGVISRKKQIVPNLKY
jgi:manganese-dependent inorganic pyrophosphatase